MTQTFRHWCVLHRQVVALAVLCIAALVTNGPRLNALPVAGSLSMTALAQGAEASTPIASNDPSACRVAPRSIDNLAALASAGLATPGAANLGEVFGEPPSLQGGVPADSEVVQSVTATLQELIACTNTGDFLRISALWSDDMLMNLYRGIRGTDEHVTAESIATELATPPAAASPAPDQRASLEAVSDVRVLDDGRVTAVTQINGDLTLFVLIKSGPRYLIDASYPVPAGTPTP